MALLLLPLSLHAALSSTNYTIESPSIGNTGGAEMSSTNYSVSPRNGNTYTTSGVDDEEDEDQDEDSNSQGSGTKIKKKPNVQQIISAIFDTDLTGERSTFPGVDLDRVAYNVGAGAKVTESDDSRVQDETNGSEKGKDNEEDSKDSSLLASLISSDFEQVLAKLNGAYVSLFSHFAARAVFFIWVLAFLYFIRANTHIGRKYSPF
ncbi:MAG: hypothetical protein WAW13_05100 [Minisyncoccia bacterium]